MKNRISFFSGMAWLLGWIFLFANSEAAAQSYPNRPITMVVPFSAGGSLDILARSYATELSAHLGQPVVVENKAGAGGSLGASFVAHAPRDGYTLLFGSISTQVINPILKISMPYNAEQDLIAISRLNDGPLVLVVPAIASITTLQALIAQSKSNPRGLTFASAGVGSISHLGGELFKAETGANLTHVPYKGGSAALGDLYANTVDMMIETVPNALSGIKTGRLRPIAISGTKRSSVLQQVPTFEELGMQGMTINAWTGLFAPSRVPAAVVTRLVEASQAIAKSKPYQNRIKSFSYEVAAGNSPSEFSDYISKESTRWKSVARHAGIEPE